MEDNDGPPMGAANDDEPCGADWVRAGGGPTGVTDLPTASEETVGGKAPCEECDSS